MRCLLEFPLTCRDFHAGHCLLLSYTRLCRQISFHGAPLSALGGSGYVQFSPSSSANDDAGLPWRDFVSGIKEHVMYEDERNPILESSLIE
jgi:hypothetical protein